MGIHSEAILNRKFIEMIKLLNIYLNHFPKFEKYALANNIRNTAYTIYDLITEAQKRYFKKTSLTQLDVEHEKLRMQVYLANELGYFNFKDGRNDSTVNAAKTATMKYYRKLLIEFSILNLLPIRSQKCLFM